jgi:hypothetical protein
MSKDNAYEISYLGCRSSRPFFSRSEAILKLCRVDFAQAYQLTYQEIQMASNQGNNNNPEGKNQFSSGNQSGGQGGQSGQGGQGNQGGQNQSDTSNRGFASMDPQRQREIASEGGKASHEGDNAGGSESSSGRDQDRGRNEGSGNSGSNQSR